MRCMKCALLENRALHSFTQTIFTASRSLPRLPVGLRAGESVPKRRSCLPQPHFTIQLKEKFMQDAFLSGTDTTSPWWREELA